MQNTRFGRGPGSSSRILMEDGWIHNFRAQTKLNSEQLPSFFLQPLGLVMNVMIPPLNPSSFSFPSLPTTQEGKHLAGGGGEAAGRGDRGLRAGGGDLCWDRGLQPRPRPLTRAGGGLQYRRGPGDARSKGPLARDRDRDRVAPRSVEGEPERIGGRYDLLRDRDPVGDLLMGDRLGDMDREPKRAPKRFRCLAGRRCTGEEVRMPARLHPLSHCSPHCWYAH
jgi:hypothetical protein